MTSDRELQVFINGALVSNAQVRAWEHRRARAALSKLGSRLGRRGVAEILRDADIRTLMAANLDRQREALLTLKLGLGHAGIYSLLRHELAVSERTARLAIPASRGHKAYSAIRILAPGHSATEFGEWFDSLTATNAEADMLVACPDHYLLRGLADGRQEVVETTGGSPAATRFLVDYASGDKVTVPKDPQYPVQIAGQAVLDDGLVIGGVRHQFRQCGDAMEALLTVEFPSVFPKHMISQHRWHLATEFGNWINASPRTTQ